MGGEVARGVMLYAKGGYTNAKLTAVYDDGVSGPQSGRVRLDGYRLGAGVETNVAGFMGRLEYRYSSYNDFEDTVGTNPERHQVALLVGYRF
jgi:outer membrane immunogenic protein